MHVYSEFSKNRATAQLALGEAIERDLTDVANGFKRGDTRNSRSMDTPSNCASTSRKGATAR